ncbi:MAG: bifunctional phosphoribosyl-AMP cyclohydrolase/phosphoribosyl-ATP diphosphatase HisIE [Spirochaetales bacterium]
MVIASIDLKGGKVVQLKNGKETVLERDDADSLLAEFNKVAEVAVIDLDGALEHVIREGDKKGQTSNTEILKSLLRKGNVRVGGGIRTVKKAKELISLGAEKVIIGSSAFENGQVNINFLRDLEAEIGKQRIIVAVDSLNGIITVRGWTESTGIPLVEGAKIVEKYASELLFTCVEKEGCMQGIDMDQVRSIREAITCRLVAAGGVSSLDEIIALQNMNVDVQLGMALYTQKVSLQESFIRCLNWKKADENSNGLIPVIAQSVAGEVLMTGFANTEAFEKTLSCGNLTFWSRTRNTLWTKGETSGNTLSVVKLRADCDRDTVLATVIPTGSTCHTGSWTCFTSESNASSNLNRLESIIAQRFANPTPGSYTATLDATRVREKIVEESEELTEADTKADVVWEVSDLIYFVSVLMHQEGVTWQDIYDELDRRHKK